MKYKSGVLQENEDNIHLDIYTGGPNGLEFSMLKINGYVPGAGNLEDIKLADWDGDGHLDIWIPADRTNKNGLSESAEVYLNDGIGNFNRLAQKFIPGWGQPSCG